MFDNIPLVMAAKGNYNLNTRKISDIKYICIHYTGNIGDTAKNNADYFAGTVTQTSAHYFVSDNSVYHSVPDNHAAYTVGLGSRKEPYFKWPIMWKKITNSNSISIELCGSKNSREASEATKRTAAQLTAYLLKKYNLTPKCVYRHYDVTGKECPKWAVDDPLKWLDFQLLVTKFFYGSDEEMLNDTPENYMVFKTFMDRYIAEQAAKPATWEAGVMLKVQARGLMDGTRPKSNITRGEVAQILENLRAENG